MNKFPYEFWNSAPEEKVSRNRRNMLDFYDENEIELNTSDWRSHVKSFKINRLIKQVGNDLEGDIDLRSYKRSLMTQKKNFFGKKTAVDKNSTQHRFTGLKTMHSDDSLLGLSPYLASHSPNIARSSQNHFPNYDKPNTEEDIFEMKGNRKALPYALFSDFESSQTLYPRRIPELKEDRKKAFRSDLVTLMKLSRSNIAFIN